MRDVGLYQRRRVSCCIVIYDVHNGSYVVENRISAQEPDQGIMRQVSDTLSGAIEG